MTASRRPLSARARTGLERELRDLTLRRAHVDTVVARMDAARPTTAKVLANLRLAAGDAARARARLVESHLRLVAALARRHPNNGLELPDLVQEGTIGLMRAADRFDARHQVTFATYAAWWVRQTIGRAISSRARTVRLPGGVEEGLRKIRRHRRHLTLEKCRLPTTAELADATRLTEDRVDDLERIEHDLCQPMVSFDSPVSDDDDGRAPAEMLADQHWPNPEDATVARRLVAHASDALDVLAPREREVIRLRYGIDRDREHTLEDIGKEFGLTRQRILQIASKAIEKLRTSGHALQLQTFWKP
jgi:RNA polymerase primary sigma factor